jgi:glyoxylase-like metal-dependent hydrolase (beta-lactamase superfamily II)
MGLDVSAYVVHGVLIDTAFPDVSGELSRWLDGHPVRGAIVTHYHEDHAGNVGELAVRQVPTWIAPTTRSHLERPTPIGLYRRLCWGTPRPLAIAPPPFEDESLAVIATPGHSHDHHVVWDADTGTVFGADLFLGVKVRVAHPPEREDVREQIASLRRVIALAPSRYFDAHRGPIENPLTLLSSKLAWMEETTGRIDELIAQGLGDAEIARRVLGRREMIDYVSMDDYSRRNVVRSVRATKK